MARFTFTQADIGADTAVMLGELYRKAGAWRVRSVGDGFTGGLPTMLSRFRITPGAVASNSPRGSVVLASAPQGLWLPKTWPGGVQPSIPKDLARAVGLTITTTEDGTVHTGTGFMVSPGGHFVTCHHVVHDAAELSVAFGGSTSLRRATVVALDRDSDLALCCVEDRNGSPDWLLPVGPDVSAGLGDELGLLGYPLGVDLGMSVTYSQGIVNSLRKKHGVDVLQIDVGAAPGSSGGPVFRRSDGNVVGVLTSGLDVADRGMLINFAVDIRNLWKLGWMQRLS
jgi:S1-C subfamily serine protease